MVTAAPSNASEADLVARAQAAVSQCNWEVGECAALWTKRFSKGRTDADFAQLVGLSADQTYQRRRVWETFGDVASQYTQLKWSHFYTALTWDDAAECLQWAEEVQATVAEMKAWRRAQRGEDLTEPADEEIPFDLPVETALVRTPGEAANLSSEGREHRAEGARAPVAAGVARLSSEDAGYAPYSDQAMPVPGSNRSTSEPAEPPTPAALLKRLTSMLERCANALTPQFAEEFSALREKDQKRFWKAFETLQERVSDLQ